MLDQSDIEHLLRRTEYLARPARVAALTAMPSIEAAVDDVLDVPADPGSVQFVRTDEIQRGAELTHFWLDRMAHDSPRPIQEKMAFFWHGHFCSDIGKVRTGALMREQIDLFRHQALSDLRFLATEMSTQVAMLRYLDNNQNKRASPNQNFARELLELFLLGVGNYTESDVEAATAAWTGHTDDPVTGAYIWNPHWHETAPQAFMGRTVNSGGDPTRHGAQTIDVVLGDGVVPGDAPVLANRGRPSREVAAEFVSTKLWIEFAGTEPPAGVLAALRDAALAADFAIVPWVRTLLTLPEFYDQSVKRGLVRSPVDYMVALLAATGRRSGDTSPLWRMEGMGQRPLYPPNVSGWKHNAAFVSAGAMSKRTEAAQILADRAAPGYVDGDGLIRLAGGAISRHEIEVLYAAQPQTVLDRILELMGVTLSPDSYDTLLAFAVDAPPSERIDLVHMIFLTHDFHLA